MFKRIFLFVAANIAIIAVISIVFSVFGLQPYLSANGINYQSLLVFSAIIGFVGSFFSLFISKWMAKTTYNITPIENPQGRAETFVVQTVQRLAEQAGIGMPEVGIYQSPSANAFATGWNRNNALVAVSTALLEQMDQDEIEGVLAHEISHIANGDMVTMTLLQGVINTFVIFFARIAAFAVQSFLNRGRDDGGQIGGLVYYLTAIVFEILFGILASTIVMWFSRHREFRADAGSANLVGAHKMIASLKRLQLIAAKVPVEDKRGKGFKTMKISDQSGVLHLFRSHPPLEKRIEALQMGSQS
jgi:heat shock protein HtpX